MLTCETLTLLEGHFLAPMSHKRGCGSRVTGNATSPTAQDAGPPARLVSPAQHGEPLEAKIGTRDAVHHRHSEGAAQLFCARARPAEATCWPTAGLRGCAPRFDHSVRGRRPGLGMPSGPVSPGDWRDYVVMCGGSVTEPERRGAAREDADRGTAPPGCSAFLPDPGHAKRTP